MRIRSLLLGIATMALMALPTMNMAAAAAISAPSVHAAAAISAPSVHYEMAYSQPDMLASDEMRTQYVLNVADELHMLASAMSPKSFKATISDPSATLATTPHKKRLAMATSAIALSHYSAAHGSSKTQVDAYPLLN